MVSPEVLWPGYRGWLNSQQVNFLLIQMMKIESPGQDFASTMTRSKQSLQAKRANRLEIGLDGPTHSVPKRSTQATLSQLQ